MATVKSLEKTISTYKVAMKASKNDALKAKLRAKISAAEAQLEKLKSKSKPKKSGTPARRGAKSNSERFAEAKKKRASQILSTRKSDIEKDAGRPALPKGYRIAKTSGQRYWEGRENRIDRRPQKYARLEQGGMMADGGGIPEGYHMMPDGSMMADSAHMAYGGMMAKGGVSSKEKFYEGQSIMLKPITTKSLIDALPEWNKYANKELVIEKIEFDSPYKKATKAFVRSTGDKVPFNIYLNDSIEQYADGGMMARGGSTKTYKEVKKDKLKDINDEITTLNTYLKKLENENSEEAYKASENLRKYKSILEAKKLNLEDKMASGGMMAKGGELHRLEEGSM